MEVKEIIELMKAVSDNGLTKFELEHGDTKLVMKREKQMVTVSGAGQTMAAGASVIAAGHVDGVVGSELPVYIGDSMVYTESGTAAKEQIVEGNVIRCPLVGTFYSSPSPDAETFVKVGDHVKKGQVVAIVEAMKLMNEIESEYDGVVEAVLVDNESMVEYGQPLFKIR